MKVEVLCIGDELLIGLRDNTHLTFLGELLARHGLEISRSSVFRDEPESIRDCFEESWKRADLIITTGGLGPTADDLTRETIAEALGTQLVHNQQVEDAIRHRFERMGRQMTDNNLRQAMIPDGAELIENHYGTAPGIWFERGGKTLVMLPGPSNELRPMFREQVLPKLATKGFTHERDPYMQMRVFGLGESALATKLDPVFSEYNSGLNVAYCAHSGMVDVRLSQGNGDLDDDAIKAIAERCRDLLGEDFTCFGDYNLPSLVLGHLRKLEKTLAVAESCTGGMMSSVFTDVPGASKVFKGGVVCYANSAKMDMLDVPECIIQQHGAVSAECAAAMATGVAENLGADYGLSITGFAGPGGGTAEHPVGTVFLGYHSPVGVWSRKVVYPGNRLQVKERAVNASLDWLRRKLRNYIVDDMMAACSCR